MNSTFLVKIVLLSQFFLETPSPPPHLRIVTNRYYPPGACMTLRVSKPGKPPLCKTLLRKDWFLALVVRVKFPSGTTESLHIISLGILPRPGLKDLLPHPHPVTSDSGSRRQAGIAGSLLQLPVKSQPSLLGMLVNQLSLSLCGASSGCSSWLGAMCFHFMIPSLLL